MRTHGFISIRGTVEKTGQSILRNIYSITTQIILRKTCLVIETISKKQRKKMTDVKLTLYAPYEGQKFYINCLT